MSRALAVVPAVPEVKPESGAGGATAASQQTGPAGESESARKKRLRLERNKECARECRRRKRDHTSELEARVAALEAENSHLEMQIKEGGGGQGDVEKAKDGVVLEMARMLEKGGAKMEADLMAKIKEFGERHADYGMDRRVAVQWHLQQAELLLVPTQGTTLPSQRLNSPACWPTRLCP